MAFASQTLLENGHGEGQNLLKLEGEEDIDSHYSGTPLRFLPLRHVYSATSPCSGSPNVVSKKVRARKLTLIDDNLDNGGHRLEKIEEEKVRARKLTLIDDNLDNGGEKIEEEEKSKPQVIQVYSRRRKKKPLFNSLVEKFEDEIVVKSEPVDEGFVVGEVEMNKKRRVGRSELVKLGVDSSEICRDNGPRLRESRFQYDVSRNKSAGVKRKRRNSSDDASKDQDGWRAKKWFQYVASHLKIH